MLPEEHGHRDHIAKGARETAQVLGDTMAAVTAEGETVNQDLKSAMQLAEERMKALKKHEDDVRSWSEAAGKKARDDAESIASRAAQRAKEVEKSAGVQAAKTLAEAKDQAEKIKLAAIQMQSQIMEQLESLKAETLKQTMALEAQTKAKMKALRQETERDNAEHIERARSTGKKWLPTHKPHATGRQRLEKLSQREEHVENCIQAVRELVKGDPHRPIKLNVSGTMFVSDMTTICERHPNNKIARIVGVDKGTQDPSDGSYYVNGNPTHFHLVLDYLRRGTLPVVGGMSELKWLEREAECYQLEELAELCRGSHKRLDVIDVMQLLNGQKNLSGMDMHGLTLSDIDFSSASLYHAQLDDNNMQRIVAHKANFRGASMRGADLSGADLSGADLRDCDLTNAILSRSNLTDALMGGANGERARTRSILTDAGEGCRFPGSKGARGDAGRGT